MFYPILKRELGVYFTFSYLQQLTQLFELRHVHQFLFLIFGVEFVVFAECPQLFPLFLQGLFGALFLLLGGLSPGLLSGLRLVTFLAFDLFCLAFDPVRIGKGRSEKRQVRFG